ncbi:MAG TPA: hypothetical protein DD409_09145 [Bacteroidales bacterium]|nr:hypothetical protein [Bacteroidales bacterium]
MSAGAQTYRPGSTWVSQHALSINGKRIDITKPDLLLVGDTIGCKKAAEIIEETVDTVHQWKRFANDVQVQPDLRDTIDKTLVRL